MPTLLTTIAAMNGGVNAVAGVPANTTVTLGGTFNPGDKLSLNFTDLLTAITTLVGVGNVSGVQFNSVFTFNNKVYGTAGATFYYCAIDDPTTWNDPNASGNGFDTTSNIYATNEDLAALASYQGKMLAVSRRNVQVWIVDPDPANYDAVQVLPNIGTVAGLSVVGIGDQDVYMLADNGVRSVRVRDSSNNAIIADVGTPIDAILQPLLSRLTDAQKATACGIAEPSSNRYWVYVPQPDGSAGSIYVFSYFSSSQIAAWGTYSPTYQVAVASPAANYTASVVTYTGLTIGKRYAWLPGAHETSITNGAQVLKKEGAFTATAPTATVAGSGAAVTFTGALSLTTPFVPQKFFVDSGQVWCRAGDLLLSFGGSSGQGYDNCGVTWTTPFIDGGTPATRKQFESIDSAFQGNWQVSACADYTATAYKLIYDNTASSFLYEAIGWQASGTHYSVKGVEAGSGYALFSSASVHQKVANEK